MGDDLKVGDVVAHASVGDLIIGIETNFKGVMARLNVNEGETVPADSEIALVVNDRDDYTKFLEMKEMLAHEQQVTEFHIPPPASPKVDDAAVGAIDVAAANDAGDASPVSPPTATATTSTSTMTTTATTEKGSAKASDVLREIKVLINGGIIQEESGELKIYDCIYTYIYLRLYNMW